MSPIVLASLFVLFNQMNELDETIYTYGGANIIFIVAKAEEI